MFPAMSNFIVIPISYPNNFLDPSFPTLPTLSILIFIFALSKYISPTVTKPFVSKSKIKEKYNECAYMSVIFHNYAEMFEIYYVRYQLVPWFPALALVSFPSKSLARLTWQPSIVCNSRAIRPPSICSAA